MLVLSLKHRMWVRCVALVQLSRIAVQFSFGNWLGAVGFKSEVVPDELHR